MALVRDLSKAQLAFQVAGRAVDEFNVLRYRGSEGLSQLFRFEVELSSTLEGQNLDALVGKPAAFSINTDTGTRWFHGCSRIATTPASSRTRPPRKSSPTCSRRGGWPRTASNSR